MGRSLFVGFKKFILILALLYVFVLSINLMGASFKLFGKGFAEGLLKTTSNPFAGLLIGILATSIIQSSSTTTSITVGLVASNALSLRVAVPIIMGANIGTTVTNTIVSIGHITKKEEFQRAFAGATVHDFFNILSVMVLFPLELSTHILEKSAGYLTKLFVGAGGIHLLSPIKLVTKPVIHLLEQFMPPIVMLVISLVLLFLALTGLVKTMKSLVIKKIELFLDAYLFRNDFTSFLLGLVFTSVVQSSSVTTSLAVPLVGAGVLTIKKIFPYTLGANVGTTVTAIMAAFATLNPAAITIAFVHLLFNIFGIMSFYPLRKVPISIAQSFSRMVCISKERTVFFLILYFLAYTLPLAIIIFLK